MFHVGDIIRCGDSASKNPLEVMMHVKGLMISQRFEVIRTFNWDDGSQSLWVKYVPRSKSTAKDRRGAYDETTIRGPYCHLRFKLEQEGDRMSEYDPSQAGDKEDDI